MKTHSQHNITMATTLLPLLLSLLSLSAMTTADEKELAAEGRLLKDLMQDYQPSVRPSGNENGTVVIKFGMALIHINELDEKHGTLNINAWIRQLWNDDRLKWDPAEYDGVNTIRAPSNLVWKPDITLYNSASDLTYDPHNQYLIVLYNTGDVLWIPTQTIHSKCNMDMTYFPFDEQTCSLKFGSWTYDGNLVDVEFYEALMKADLSDYTPHIEFEITNVAAVKNTKYYPCCAEPYPDLTFNITMVRINDYFGYMYVGPVMLVSFLIPFIFVLPSLHSARALTAVALLVIMTILLDTISFVFPTVSGDIPLISRYYVGVFVLSGLAMAMSILVTTVANWANGSRPPPAIVNKVVLGVLARVVCVRPDEYASVRESDDVKLSEEDNGEPGNKGGHQKAHQWVSVAQTLDRFLILLFSVLVAIFTIYIISHMSGRERKGHDHLMAN